jgi:hypothetical protein
MDKLPLSALRAMAELGTRVIVAHDSVAEHRPELAGGRTGPGTRTWDDVQGMYSRSSRELVISVDDARRWPGVVQHEAGHAVDQAHGVESLTPEFAAAYRKDNPDFGKDPPDESYRDFAEMYAESFNDYVAGRKRFKNQYAYWTCSFTGQCGSPPEAPPCSPPRSCRSPEPPPELAATGARAEEFAAARDADLDRLSERHRHPEAGQFNTYADSLADYHLGNRRWPKLYDYWACRLGGRCPAAP